jgi:hypothetical protein
LQPWHAAQVTEVRKIGSARSVRARIRHRGLDATE